MDFISEYITITVDLIELPIDVPVLTYRSLFVLTTVPYPS